MRATSSCKRTPRVHADLPIEAQGHHLVFFLPVNQVVLVLHSDEFRPVIAFGYVLQSLELPSIHSARSDVSGLAGLDHVVKGLHDFLHRRKWVKPVDLVEVNIVEAKTLQAVVDFGHDVLA